MDKNITYKPFGKKAILIEWQPIIDAKILEDILLFKQKIQAKYNDKLIDLVVGYNSLTLLFKTPISAFDDELIVLKALYATSLKLKKSKNYIWEIPVCYHLDFGFDLEEISIRKKITVPEIIQLHTQVDYTVFFIGFLPGFLYLGGLKEELFLNRKSNPRLNVPKGAVAIGGKQTGVYPTESAGGWQVIGKTPIAFFNIDKKNPCFAKPGDKIRFRSISKKEYDNIEKEITDNSYQILKTKLDD